MWPRRSHVLIPLTNLRGKTRFIREKEHQEAFEVMKLIMVMDVLMTYPNHNLPFQYCPGKDNVLADCFSRLPCMAKPTEGKSMWPNTRKLVAFDKLDAP
eukprot:10621411-Ditylum_brightwellii.AAC.1